MTEREHCEAVAQDIWGEVNGWDELSRIIARERAAARAQALEEAAALMTKQALFSREQDFLADGVDLDRYADDIRALKVTP